MPEEVRLWEIESSNKLKRIRRASLNLEKRLEDWLDQDISMLADNLLVIGRQLETDFGGMIDLLCMDNSGDLVIVELKRDKTPREITAQVLDYASWVKNLSNDRISEIAADYLEEDSLEDAFSRKFDSDLPEVLNESHKMLVVASTIDPSSERIISYLSDSYGVAINAATFQYFRDDAEKEFLARVFLIEPSEVEYKSRQRSTSKRKPNLTWEELDSLAEERGLGDLYTHAFDVFDQRFERKYTTLSSVAFYVTIDESNVVVFSLAVKESSRDEGLKFHAYVHRLATYFQTEPDSITSLLPENKKAWRYYRNAPVEHQGIEGFFRSIEEIDSFVKGLQAKR